MMASPNPSTSSNQENRITPTPATTREIPPPSLCAENFTSIHTQTNQPKIKPTLEIRFGDLLAQTDMDVIVNAWNRNFMPRWLLVTQGVSGAIKKKAGTVPFQELRQHYKQHGTLPLGGAVLTSAGKLNFRAIIHVAGIDWNWKSSEHSIRESVRNALKLAQENNFQSIAFPVIGSGSYGIWGLGRDTALEVMKDEIRKFNFPGKVVVVIYDKGR